MLDNIFTGLFDTTGVGGIAVFDFLLCLLVSLVIGAILALAYTYKNTYTKSFLVTLSTLPAVVCVVIMFVNGNIGAGVAVAGTFSLVRFRSVPGTAKEIGAIFLAMATGLACGMGYLAYAVLFAIILSLVNILYSRLNLGEKRKTKLCKSLRITIPEDLDYTGVFDDIFDEYTTHHETVRVKTANLGSLFKITYNITLKDADKEKEFIDSLRTRNGNLEISISFAETTSNEL